MRWCSRSPVCPASVTRFYAKELQNWPRNTNGCHYDDNEMFGCDRYEKSVGDIQDKRDYYKVDRQQPPYNNSGLPSLIRDDVVLTESSIFHVTSQRFSFHVANPPKNDKVNQSEAGREGPVETSFLRGGGKDELNAESTTVDNVLPLHSRVRQRYSSIR